MEALTAYFTNLIPSVKYKVYSALINQADDGIPTATILENTLGSISFSRTSNGDYLVQSDGLFTAEATFVTIGPLSYQNSQPGFASIELEDGDESSFRLVTTSSNLTNQDNYLVNTALEIRVYIRE